MQARKLKPQARGSNYMSGKLDRTAAKLDGREGRGAASESWPGKTVTSIL
jgi:hypothetical protein